MSSPPSPITSNEIKHCCNLIAILWSICPFINNENELKNIFDICCDFVSWCFHNLESIDNAHINMLSSSALSIYIDDCFFSLCDEYFSGISYLKINNLAKQTSVLGNVCVTVIYFLFVQETASFSDLPRDVIELLPSPEHPKPVKRSKVVKKWRRLYVQPGWLAFLGVRYFQMLFIGIMRLFCRKYFGITSKVNERSSKYFYSFARGLGCRLFLKCCSIEFVIIFVRSLCNYVFSEIYYFVG